MSDNKHLDRLRMMSEPAQTTWDLSPADTVAIGWAVSEIVRLNGKSASDDALIGRLREAVRSAEPDLRAELSELKHQYADCDRRLANEASWAEKRDAENAQLRSELAELRHHHDDCEQRLVKELLLATRKDALFRSDLAEMKRQHEDCDAAVANLRSDLAASRGHVDALLRCIDNRKTLQLDSLFSWPTVESVRSEHLGSLPTDAPASPRPTPALPASQAAMIQAEIGRLRAEIATLREIVGGKSIYTFGDMNRMQAEIERLRSIGLPGRRVQSEPVRNLADEPHSPLPDAT